jgi:hypothetical protein
VDAAPAVLIKSFNDLRMGPLLQHEVVRANFKLPEHVVEIPEVCTICLIDQAIVTIPAAPQATSGQTSG